ncbi:hypothetical protein [Thiolapillus brandeum]|uniref:Cytochrome c-552/4 domain-containing protein n=1 Tax=Thiolapillus brandeum TaxID=1076588 RepID=A0A7U6GL87_9GAMM|nr:hypothetical protein [Thiolapillus brandeum]BAO45680.1 hypothetical protein TBH_C2779 [Thiolapillus brandeum]
MMKSWILAGAIGLASAMVAANPYTEGVDSARVDDEALQQARKQLDHPPAEPRKAPLFVPPFHQRSAEIEAPAVLCLQCHDRAPHRRNPRKRAFLNMHGRWIACETCHWQPEGMSLDYGRVRVPGVPVAEGLIAPLVDGKPVVTLAEEPWVRRLARDWEQADKAARVNIKARLHQPLEEKGPDCIACHDGKDSLLDWKALGYERGRVKELRDNPIARFLQRTEPESPDDPVVRIQLRDLLE